MEKIIISNDGRKIVGILHKMDISRLIILVHGFTGDKEEHGIFARSSSEFEKAGFSVFRFDFSGCGESDNVDLTIESMVSDLKTVIQGLKNRGFKKIGLLGYSLGGLISILCADRQVHTMILLSPITDKMDLTNRLNKLERETLVKTGIINIKGNKRKDGITVSKNLFEYVNSLNQKTLFSRLQTPFLVIHGGQDSVISMDSSVQASKLNLDSKLVIIQEENHGFNKNSKANEVSIKWFQSHL